WQAESMLHTGSAQCMVCVLQNPPRRLGVQQSIENSEWQLQWLLHLSAVAHAAEKPVAEVLAVIGQQAIIIFSEARSGTSDYLFGRIRRLGVIDDADWATDGKSRQGHLLDRTALPESPGEARVMHHPALSNINAMMAIAATRSRQVSAGRRFLLKMPLRIDTFVIRNSHIVHLRFSSPFETDQLCLAAISDLDS